MRQQHYGVADDPKNPDNFLYGKKTLESDHVPQAIKYPPKSKLAEYANDLKEEKYASHQREPLAKPMARNYKMPEEVKKEDFRFGVKVIPSIFKFLKI